MQRDRQTLVRVLKAELAFLESGGYWNVRVPSSRAPLIFEDSPTCLHYSPQQTSPCSECILAQLVPADHISEEIPCRYIPLNEQGETLDSLYRSANQEKVESAAARWLRAKICELQGSELRREISPSDEGGGLIKARAQSI
jgi:hypothetical protein